MLLSDDTIEHFGLTDMLDALDRDPAGRWRLADDALPLLEAMLRTLVRDPDRLEQVERLIADLTPSLRGARTLTTDAFAGY